MQVPVYDLKGEVAENIDLNDDVFGLPLNGGLVHQALVRQLANRRQGTVETKTRSTVSGSGKKLSAQKHTGRARRGDITSPTLSGGAVAFGPHRRDYRQAMPKKMRRIALRCILSVRAGDGSLKVVSEFDPEGVKTAQLAEALKALGIKGSVLIATEQADPVVIQAARNLPAVDTTPAALLNVADIMSHKTLLMTVAAVRKAEQTWAPAKGGSPKTADSAKGS
ncbi:MAG: 50S ribosomal protein L4 [Dehalococcoidia bacterium]|nr:50S ribosomal protein L4 [Dehalococcoidia bacterium]